MVVQVTENEASHGDMYQAWAQMGDTMTVLTPDEDLSTDLMFVTPELTEEQHLVKLSVIVSSEATDSLYLNGDKLNVSYDSTSYWRRQFKSPGYSLFLDLLSIPFNLFVHPSFAHPLV